MSSSSFTEGALRCRLWLLAVLLTSGPAQGSPLEARIGGSTATVDIAPLVRLRFGATVPQSRDFSCGAAAVATLLTFHFESRTTEQEVFEFMWNAGDREQIRARGFSLLDIQGFLAAHGYSGEGYRISLDQLRSARLPAIALITVQGYRHFVVIKGIRDAHVALGDPAVGTRIMPRDEFEGARDPILFVVRSDARGGRAHFDTARDWETGPPAPLESAHTTGIDALDGLLRPRLNEF
jgi:uncharacterized protein